MPGKYPNKYEKPFNWEKWRNFLYYFKLTGFIWFKGSLPVKYDGDFGVHFNIHRIEEDRPHELVALNKLETSVLEYLCNLMAVPSWVNNNKKDARFHLSFMQDVFDKFDIPD